jgi:hypothetical protein
MTKQNDIQKIEGHRVELEHASVKVLLSIVESDLNIKLTRNNDGISDIYLSYGDGVWFRLSVRVDVVLYPPSDLEEKEGGTDE